jgi:DNA-binding NarL/FixJ family response regulator
MGRTFNLGSAHSAKWRVYVGGEDTLIAEVLARRLNLEPDLAVCGLGNNAVVALREIAQVQPHIALLEVPAGGQGWIRLVRQLKEASPRLKILALCGEPDPSRASRILRAGADGCVMRGEKCGEIAHALRDTLAGLLYVSDQIVTARAKPSSRRSPAGSLWARAALGAASRRNSRRRPAHLKPAVTGTF